MLLKHGFIPPDMKLRELAKGGIPSVQKAPFSQPLKCLFYFIPESERQVVFDLVCRRIRAASDVAVARTGGIDRIRCEIVA